jgi:hypothetical protein
MHNSCNRKYHCICRCYHGIVPVCDHADEPEPGNRTRKNRWLKLAGAISGGCLLLVLVAALRNTEIKKEFAEVNSGDIGLIQNLGKNYSPNYIVPFEISSVLFLSAMVGAVVIGKEGVKPLSPPAGGNLDRKVFVFCLFFN